MEPLVWPCFELRRLGLNGRPREIGLGSTLNEAPLKTANALLPEDGQVRADPAADMAGHPFGDEERAAEGFEVIDNPGKAFRTAIGVKADHIGEREGCLIDAVVVSVAGGLVPGFGHMSA